MRVSVILASAAALSFTATPALAGSSNPAASLSVSPSVRAGSASEHGNKLAGGGAIYAIIIIAGIVAIAAVGASNSGTPRSG